MEGSLKVEVLNDTGGFPFTIRLYSTAAAVKVNSLESGSRPHTIAARNFDEIWLPRLPPGQTRGDRIFNAYGNNGKKRAVGPSVEHPGNPPFRFMQRGLDAAIRAAFGK
jgi:hypothetical protein